MAQVYEQNLVSNGQVFFRRQYPEAQTFTPAVLHDIGSVKLQMRRTGLPGTLTVSIRYTAGGLPSGDDLCVGTIDANSFTTASPGEWYEIILTPEIKVIAGGMYAIVCRVSGGDTTNYIRWRWSTANPYPGGTRCYSLNYGSSWSMYVPADLTFQVLGPGCSGVLVNICSFFRDVGTFFIDLSIDIAELWVVGEFLAEPFEFLGELFYDGADICCSASGMLQTLLDGLENIFTADSLLTMFQESFPTLYVIITDPVGWFLVQLTLAFDLEPWHTQSLEFLAKWILEEYFPTLYQVWLNPEDWLAILLEDRFPILYYLVVDPKGEILYLIGQAFDLTPWEAQSAEFIVKALFERYFLTLYQFWLDPEAWLVEHVDPRILGLPEMVAAFWDDPWGWLFDQLEDQIETYVDRIGEITLEIIARLLGV